MKDLDGGCPICGELLIDCHCTRTEFDEWAAKEAEFDKRVAKENEDDKGLWILTEDEHDRLAASAWYNHEITHHNPTRVVWGNVPEDEKIAWRNAVAGVLFSLSDKHGLDAVVIDY